MKKYFLLGFIIVLFMIPTTFAASEYTEAATKRLNKICKPNTQGTTAVLCYFRDLFANHEGRISNLEDATLSFPMPQFDSGWVSIPPQTTVIDIPHSVGGDINDYFIDATYRRPAGNGTFMSHQTASNKIWWEDVEPNNIQVATEGDVTNLFDAVRIRIWKIH